MDGISSNPSSREQSAHAATPGLASSSSHQPEDPFADPVEEKVEKTTSVDPVYADEAPDADAEGESDEDLDEDFKKLLAELEAHFSQSDQQDPDAQAARLVAKAKETRPSNTSPLAGKVVVSQDDKDSDGEGDVDKDEKDGLVPVLSNIGSAPDHTADDLIAGMESAPASDLGHTVDCWTMFDQSLNMPGAFPTGSWSSSASATGAGSNSSMMPDQNSNLSTLALACQQVEVKFEDLLSADEDETSPGYVLFAQDRTSALSRPTQSRSSATPGSHPSSNIVGTDQGAQSATPDRKIDFSASPSNPSSDPGELDPATRALLEIIMKESDANSRALPPDQQSPAPPDSCASDGDDECSPKPDKAKRRKERKERQHDRATSEMCKTVLQSSLAQTIKQHRIQIDRLVHLGGNEVPDLSPRMLSELMVLDPDAYLARLRVASRPSSPAIVGLGLGVQINNDSISHILFGQASSDRLGEYASSHDEAVHSPYGRTAAGQKPVFDLGVTLPTMPMQSTPSELLFGDSLDFGGSLFSTSDMRGNAMTSPNGGFMNTGGAEGLLAEAWDGGNQSDSSSTGSPSLVTPPFGSNELMQYDQFQSPSHRRRNKGKQRAEPPGTPRQARSRRASRNRVRSRSQTPPPTGATALALFEMHAMDVDEVFGYPKEVSLALAEREAEDLHIAIGASLEDVYMSPESNHMVEGESPSGPSRARPDDDEDICMSDPSVHLDADVDMFGVSPTDQDVTMSLISPVTVNRAQNAQTTPTRAPVAASSANQDTSMYHDWTRYQRAWQTPSTPSPSDSSTRTGTPQVSDGDEPMNASATPDDVQAVSRRLFTLSTATTPSPVRTPAWYLAPPTILPQPLALPASPPTIHFVANEFPIDPQLLAPDDIPTIPPITVVPDEIIEPQLLATNDVVTTPTITVIPNEVHIDTQLLAPNEINKVPTITVVPDEIPTEPELLAPNEISAIPIFTVTSPSPPESPVAYVHPIDELFNDPSDSSYPDFPSTTDKSCGKQSALEIPTTPPRSTKCAIPSTPVTSRRSDVLALMLDVHTTPPSASKLLHPSTPVAAKRAHAETLSVDTTPPFASRLAPPSTPVAAKRSHAEMQSLDAEAPSSSKLAPSSPAVAFNRPQTETQTPSPARTPPAAPSPPAPSAPGKRSRDADDGADEPHSTERSPRKTKRRVSVETNGSKGSSSWMMTMMKGLCATSPERPDTSHGGN